MCLINGMIYDTSKGKVLLWTTDRMMEKRLGSTREVCTKTDGLVKWSIAE